MKKTYIAPTMELYKVEPATMIAQSMSFGDDEGSHTAEVKNFFDDDATDDILLFNILK